MKNLRRTWTLAGIAVLGLACNASAPTTQPASPEQHGEHAHQATAKDLANAASASAQASAAEQEGALTRVTDRSLVCMVNNQFMARPQIPIEVDGRTYYGCCEMCKGRLAQDPSSRTATDPVSQQQVDKATAVIGKTADGSTLYFESEQTFAAFSKEASQKR